ncbi:MAG: ribonuclease HI family protein [Parcubacteria group bacterium]|nr:ribonuclease HI family protein [Parcubacteria group bacterium]
MDKIIVYIDGGSRGNPGPAAFGVAFPNKKYSEFLGRTTNNEAEYKGLIFALKKAKSLYGKDKVKNMEIEVRSDSELLVKQMNGEYKVKNEGIQKLFLIAWNLTIDFKKLKIVHILREENKVADALANEALDNEKRPQKLF